MTLKPFLSIVIPAYNEEARIKETLDAVFAYLKSQSYEAEVIVVDDGSRDGTAEICQTYASQHEHCMILTLPVNRGKGCAVRTGMLEAKGDYVLMSDADLATPIEELDGFWPQINEGFDVVIASRALPGSILTKHQPFYRESLGRCFNRIIQILAIPGIKDTQCGFKLFTRQASDAVFRLCKSEGFSFDIEALYVARKLGFKIKEAPVHWSHMEGSKVKMLRDGPGALLDTLRIRLRHTRTSPNNAD